MNNRTLESLYDEIAPKVGHETFMAAANRVDSLITELTELTIAGNEWAEANSYPAVENYPQYQRAREIGKVFLQLAGFKGMQTAVGSVRKRLHGKGLDGSSLILMEYGWSGIGGWQS